MTSKKNIADINDEEEKQDNTVGDVDTEGTEGEKDEDELYLIDLDYWMRGTYWWIKAQNTLSVMMKLKRSEISLKRKHCEVRLYEPYSNE